jgi:hypothetical protein
MRTRHLWAVRSFAHIPHRRRAIRSSPSPPIPMIAGDAILGLLCAVDII